MATLGWIVRGRFGHPIRRASCIRWQIRCSAKMGGKDDPMSDVVFIGDDEEDSGSASISISTENERGDTCAFRNSGATSSEMARSSDGWGDLFLDEVGIQEEEEEEEENQRFRQRRYGDPHDSGPERVFIVGVGKKGGPEDAALEYDIGPLTLIVVAPL